MLSANPRVTTGRPLRILIVADSLETGGAERHVVGLSSSLVAAGHSVTIACSTGGALAPLARHNGAAVLPLLSALVKRRISLAFAVELRRLVHEQPFDVVHAHMYASAAAAALATCGCPAPLVLTEHSEAGWRRPPARLFSRFIYQRARRVVAVSEGIRRRLLEVDHVPSTRISVIPNALPELRHTPEEPTAPLAPALQGRPRVGVVARLQPEKGVRFFLQAAALCASGCPEAVFVIVGDGPERDALMRLSVELGIGHRCHFLGFRLDAPALLGQLDVAVVPSLSEGTPLVVLEAMAAGIPVIASAVGGIPEQVRPEREGLLVPPADPRMLAAALQQMLLNPARARALGRNGQQRVAERYSAAVMLEDTLAVYRAAMNVPSRRGHRDS